MKSFKLISENKSQRFFLNKTQSSHNKDVKLGPFMSRALEEENPCNIL